MGSKSGMAVMSYEFTNYNVKRGNMGREKSLN